MRNICSSGAIIEMWRMQRREEEMVRNPHKGHDVVAAEDPDIAPSVWEAPHAHRGEVVDFDAYGNPIVRWSNGTVEAVSARYIKEATP